MHMKDFMQSIQIVSDLYIASPVATFNYYKIFSKQFGIDVGVLVRASFRSVFTCETDENVMHVFVFVFFFKVRITASDQQMEHNISTCNIVPILKSLTVGVSQAGDRVNSSFLEWIGATFCQMMILKIHQKPISNCIVLFVLF